MFAMVVDDMTTMGDAIAIVDCCLLAILAASRASASVSYVFNMQGLFIKRSSSTNLQQADINLHVYL